MLYMYILMIKSQHQRVNMIVCVPKDDKEISASFQTFGKHEISRESMFKTALAYFK